MKAILFLLCFTLLCFHGQAESTQLESLAPNDQLYLRPWSVLLYGGRTSTLTIRETISFQFEDADESVYSAELAYLVPRTHAVTRFLDRFHIALQLAGNLALRFAEAEDDPAIEVDLYPMLRLLRFPWNRGVATTFAFGAGLSYVSRVPPLEEKDSDPYRNLMIFLTLELTLAHPRYSRLQFVARIHHRSNGFGLISSGHNGSNTIGGGIRYHFS